MMSRYVFTRRGMSLFAFLFALRERERECNASAGLENIWARDLSTFLGRSLRRVLLFDRLHRFEEGAVCTENLIRIDYVTESPKRQRR
jgi:hypothetical protein